MKNALAADRTNLAESGLKEGLLAQARTQNE